MDISPFVKLWDRGVDIVANGLSACIAAAIGSIAAVLTLYFKGTIERVRAYEEERREQEERKIQAKQDLRRRQEERKRFAGMIRRAEYAREIGTRITEFTEWMKSESLWDPAQHRHHRELGQARHPVGAQPYGQGQRGALRKIGARC